MADISQIKIKGVDFNIKDASSRESIDAINEALKDKADKETIPMRSVSGTSISVTDSKEAPMILNSTVRNLLPCSITEFTYNGITFTKNADGSITANGTATGTIDREFTRFTFTEDDIGKTFSYNGCDTQITDWYAYLYIVNINGNTAWRDRRTFTIESAHTVKVKMYIKSGKTLTNKVYYPMLEESSVCNAYVPYNGYTITSCGKNLVDISEIGTWQQLSDHDFYQKHLKVKPNTEYTISQLSDRGVSEGGAYSWLYIKSGQHTDYSVDWTLTTENGCLVDAPRTITSDSEGWITVGVHGTITNDIQVQLEEGNTATSYKPFIGTKVTINKDTVFPVDGLQSFDNLTNVYNSFGANMEVTYASNETGQGLLKELETKAEKDGSNASGTWGIDITGKAVKDGSGNVITDTYLPLAGGTLDKDAVIKIPRLSDDRYTEFNGGGARHYAPSTPGYAMGAHYYKQDGEDIGGIGLFGKGGTGPEHYYIGKYDDPLLKVDMDGNTTIKKNLSVSGTINKLITQYINKNENGGNPTFLLAYDVTSMYKNGTVGSWGFNGIIYSSRTNGYINHEGVARIIMGTAYQKATAIGSTLRLATDDGNYRPCLIHDTTNDKYYLAIKLNGQGRHLVFQGYSKNGSLMGTTQLNGTGSGALPSGYEFIVDPANCTTGLGISSSCTGNSSTASAIKNPYTFNTRPTSANIDFSNSAYWNKMTYIMSTSKMTTGKPNGHGPIINIGWDNSDAPFNGEGIQLFIPENVDGKSMQFRKCISVDNTNEWSEWFSLLDSKNYSSYAIPLSGTSSLAGNIIPKTNNSYTLGSTSYRFSGAYLNYLGLYGSLNMQADANITCGSNNCNLGHYGSTSSSYWSGVYTKGIYLNGTKYSPVLYYDSTNTTTMYKSGSTSSSATMGVVLSSPSNMCLNASGGYIYLNGSYVSASSFASSDPSVKTFTEDIKTDEEKLSMLFDHIGICSYTFKTEDTNAVKFGVNAEELENLCLELGIDIDKYSFLDISYNYMLPSSDSEDCKFYTKFRYVSYNDLFALAMRELQNTKKRLNSIEDRLSVLENK